MAQEAPKTPLKSVVLDTNVLVSALLFGGLPAEIFQQMGIQFTLVVSTELLEEIEAVLARSKFARRAKLTAVDRQRFVRGLRQISRYIPWLEVVPQFKPDPKDTHLLACAKTAHAQYLVTGDKALLKLKNYHGTQIVTPRQFLDLFRS